MHRKAITVGQTVVSADDQEIQATQNALNTAKIESDQISGNIHTIDTDREGMVWKTLSSNL